MLGCKCFSREFPYSSACCIFFLLHSEHFVHLQRDEGCPHTNFFFFAHHMIHRTTFLWRCCRGEGLAVDSLLNTSCIMIPLCWNRYRGSTVLALYPQSSFKSTRLLVALSSPQHKARAHGQRGGSIRVPQETEQTDVRAWEISFAVGARAKIRELKALKRRKKNHLRSEPLQCHFASTPKNLRLVGRSTLAPVSVWFEDCVLLMSIPTTWCNPHHASLETCCSQGDKCCLNLSAWRFKLITFFQHLLNLQFTFHTALIFNNRFNIRAVNLQLLPKYSWPIECFSYLCLLTPGGKSTHVCHSSRSIDSLCSGCTDSTSLLKWKWKSHWGFNKKRFKHDSKGTGHRREQPNHSALNASSSCLTWKWGCLLKREKIEINK